MGSPAIGTEKKRDAAADEKMPDYDLIKKRLGIQLQPLLPQKRSDDLYDDALNEKKGIHDLLASQWCLNYNVASVVMSYLRFMEFGRKYNKKTRKADEAYLIDLKRKFDSRERSYIDFQILSECAENGYQQSL